jgi:endonuclease/exonuclease/phosphatase family metal-dependent hydrolase
MPTLSVVTLNILNDLARWPERRSLLADGLAGLQPDLIGLQEVALFPAGGNNAQWLAAELGGYSVHLCPKSGAAGKREAIAILSRLPVECEATLDLRTQGRVAQSARVTVEGRPVFFVNGHFYWQPGESAERVRQIERLLKWLEGFPADAALLVGGDFNGTPDSAAIRLMRRRFASAHAARHGREPEYTCPTPLARDPGLLRAVASYLLGVVANRTLKPWRGTLDYVFVNGRVRVLDCAVVLNQPAPHDPRFYPSDHFGLAARLEVI